MASERASRQLFLGASALLFAASAAATIMWSASMSTVHGLPHHTAVHHVSAVSFLGMWVVMMMAMMLPSLIPTLWRYRQTVAGTSGARSGGLTAIAGAGYFFVWTLFGAGAFALAAPLAALQMQQPAVARAAPIAVGVVVLLAGAFQFTAWKAHHLASCREGLAFAGPDISASYGEACRYGLRLGLHCSCSCAGLTTILLVIGMMDLRAMAIVTAAITAERLAPAGEQVARAIGVVTVAAGLVLIAQAAGAWSA